MPRRPTTPDVADTSLRRHVYEALREGLTEGRFVPGQKLTFRAIAAELDVSLTPVREALRRLVAEGGFEMRPNRSVRVPLMTRVKILELRDIRIAVESLAAAKAAQLATPRQVAELRRIARELAAARASGDTVTDRRKIRAFHFALYAIANQPALLRVIEGLWLQTGPYMNLMYPGYIGRARGPAARQRIIAALAAHDAAAARREIANDLRHALTYIADLADDAGNIAPKTTNSMRAPSRASATRAFSPSP